LLIIIYYILYEYSGFRVFVSTCIRNVAQVLQ